MGLFSKKKEEKSMLPDLPESNAELPALPEYGVSPQLKSDVPVNNVPPVGNPQDAIKQEIHGNTGVNQGADHGAMQKSQFEPLPHYEGAGMPAKIVAEPSHVMEDPGAHQIAGHVLHEPRTVEIHENTKVPTNVKKNQPIYIRLDKFKAGLQGFEDIKVKLTEIEDLLVKIREMKDKEERELEEWEREIQVVKARIEQIDSDVFRNVE